MADNLETGILVSEEKAIADASGAGVVFHVSRAVRKQGMTVFFDATGGVIEETSRAAVVGEAIGDLPVPTYGDKFFDGWMTSEGVAVTSKTIVGVEIETIYAKWINPVVITLDVGDGSYDGEKTFLAYEGKTIGCLGYVLPSPKHDLLNFIGWYVNGDTTYDRVTEETVYDGSFTSLTAVYVYASIYVEVQDGDYFGWFDCAEYPDFDPNGNSYINPATIMDAGNFGNIYVSYGNHNLADEIYWGGTVVVARISFEGMPDFKLWIASSAEVYDYVCASQLDRSYYEMYDPNLGISGMEYGWAYNLPYCEDWSGDGVITSDERDSVTLDSSHSYDVTLTPPIDISDYKEISYPNDGGSHFVEVVFRKDSSCNEAEDRGYFIVPKI